MYWLYIVAGLAGISAATSPAKHDWMRRYLKDKVQNGHGAEKRAEYNSYTMTEAPQPTGFPGSGSGTYPPEIGINPFGDNPFGTNPIGSNPTGTNPLGTCPLGTDYGCFPTATGSGPGSGFGGIQPSASAPYPSLPSGPGIPVIPPTITGGSGGEGSGDSDDSSGSTSPSGGLDSSFPSESGVPDSSGSGDDAGDSSPSGGLGGSESCPTPVTVTVTNTETVTVTASPDQPTLPGGPISETAPFPVPGNSTIPEGSGTAGLTGTGGTGTGTGIILPTAGSYSNIVPVIEDAEALPTTLQTVPASERLRRRRFRWH